MGILRSVIAGEDLLPYSEEDGALEFAFWGGWWLVWRDYGSCFDSRSGGFVSLYRFSPVGHFGFLLSSLGSWRRPVAGLGFGVLLVLLWVCGSAAVSAAPLVVPVPSSFFLRLYLNRPSTERKQFARRCPDAGVGRASLFFP